VILKVLKDMKLLKDDRESRQLYSEAIDGCIYNTNLNIFI
jgi:hypothetical protein